MRRTEGRKPRKYTPHKFMVEGSQRGVPFRTFYKRQDTAEADAIATGGVITDLSTLERRVWVWTYVSPGGERRVGEWRQA